jgi:hypothetical protein
MIRGKSSDFSRRVCEFYKSGIDGRIMITQDYHSAEATWNKGMIYNFKTGHPFLIRVIQEWYKENPKGLIGDVKGFLTAVGEEDEYEIEERRRKSKRNRQRQRCKVELHNILRKQRSIKSGQQASFKRPLNDKDEL